MSTRDFSLTVRVQLTPPTEPFDAREREHFRSLLQDELARRCKGAVVDVCLDEIGRAHV